MRAAVIADIHANMPALEAVSSDIGRRNVDQTINLGDCVSGPLWPRAVCQLLMASDGLVIRGNHDRWVGSADPGRMGASDRYAFSQLDDGHLRWLHALPASAIAGDGVFACHGTPLDDNEYLIETPSEGRLVRAPLTDIQQRLGNVTSHVVLCGHSHQQHLIELPSSISILNPGSVGCPAYNDRGDDPHVSECGSPHARYAVLEIDRQHVSADLIAISYDWKVAAAHAEKNGRPEWAHGLRTGWFKSILP